MAGLVFVKVSVAGVVMAAVVAVLVAVLVIAFRVLVGPSL
jgi:hypothetical protein